MHSSRTLGAVALAAIFVAGVSFAIVDVSLGDGCATGPCSNGVPIVAVTFAVLGALALLVSALPAVTWVVERVRASRDASRDEDDAESQDPALLRPSAGAATDDGSTDEGHAEGG